MARGLLTRILAHGFERGYWRRGDLLADPFGGVFTTGILCASAGLRCIGVELEGRFVELAQANIELHRQVWERCGDPLPVCVQGDSRNFAAIIRGQLAACVTSPPYATGDTAGPESLARRKDSSAAAMLKAQRWGVGGQVSEGNVASLPAGDVEAVITSPPWAGIAQDHDGRENYDKLNAAMHEGGKGHGGKMGPSVGQSYGTAPGQVGVTSGSTYWEAVKVIYGQVFQALKNGGVLCCVLKNYVAKKRVVPLTDQTAALLQHLGFRVVTRVRAMLVKETRGTDLFGGEWVEKVGRKSFFRRLYEKKYPENAIDWEEVLIARKP